MCLILVAWHVHPEFPLVVAANRDENHTRAAAAASWWPEPPILAGRDLSAGGTWLATTRDSRFAAITNFRDPTRALKQGPSRGALVPETLKQAEPVTVRLTQLQPEARLYNGFNLIFSDGERLAVFESVPGTGRVLAPGVYGLSNHLLDTPWPRVLTAKAALGAALTRLPDEQPLLELLRDQRQADDAQLPRTGLTTDWERLLSSAFIRAPNYGTRCSTLLLLDNKGLVRFSEWNWDANGAPAGQVEFAFQRAQTS
jgi:uncharacterized protein with NRDE domain